MCRKLNYWFFAVLRCQRDYVKIEKLEDSASRYFCLNIYPMGSDLKVVIFGF